MVNVFFTSDLHLGHRKVAALRGFWNAVLGCADTDAHDSHIAYNWDSVVGEFDIVYILGDMSINSGDHVLEWIAARPGIKILISGNHDETHPSFHSKAIKKIQQWGKYFAVILPFHRLKLGGVTVLLSHFPYESWGDGPERGGSETSRMNQYRLPDLGELLLHGHTHGTEKEHGRMFHVGLDAHDLQLVPQSVILDWIKSQKVIS